MPGDVDRTGGRRWRWLRTWQTRRDRELCDVVDDHVLDVGHAIEGLGHGSGIYVDLNRRLPPRENILLKLWGNFNDEDKTLRIHRCIDLCRGDLHRRLECRWSEAVRNS